MLASKYADAEPIQSNNTPTKENGDDSKNLASLLGDDEKFDWADEPVDPPSKTRKKSRSGTLESQEKTPGSEKRHSRKKSSIQVADTGSPAKPSPTSSRKKKQSTSESPLIDLTESRGQEITPTHTKKLSRSGKRIDAVSQLQGLMPPKPDPTAQPTPSTPDLVQRNATPSMSGLTPLKKAMSKRGRPCIIRVPREEEDKHRRRAPWREDEYRSRLQEFENAGFNVRGYDHNHGTDPDLVAQNCQVFPDPSEEAEDRKRGRDRTRFEVIIPDKKKWDAYMDQMMEDRLKSLGVKPVGEEEHLPAQDFEEISRQGSASFPGLAQSPPPMSSSVNSQHPWQNGLPFSAPSFSPAAFTNSTSVGALGSPGPSQSAAAPGRPGHLSRQSTYGFRSSSPILNSAFISNQALPHQFSPQLAATNMNMNNPSQSVTPLPSGVQRVPSGLSRASPDMFGLDRSLTQTPRMQANNLRTASGMGSFRRGTLLSEHSSAMGADMSPQSSQQGHGTSTPEPPLRARQNAYEELAYPTPRGHSHNISQNLEREAENPEYYPGEYINEDRQDSIPRNRADSGVPRSDHVNGSQNGHQANASHASRASSSGFNVDAKEFKFEPRTTHIKNPSINKNPFMPGNNPGGIGPPGPAVSLLTAHANGETTGGGNFNVTAPAFKPPDQGNFNFSSAFDFSKKKPDHKAEAPEDENKPDGEGKKIFSGISVAEDIVKPAKKSKAIPIVNPNAAPHAAKKAELEPEEDEGGRITQSKERFKRSKPTMLDGRNEPKFDLPKDFAPSTKVEIPTSLPKLDNKIDEKDSDFEEGEREPWHDFGLNDTKSSQVQTMKQERPIKAAYVPPHKRVNTVQDVAENDRAPPKPAVKEATEKLAEAAELGKARPKSRSPGFASEHGPTSPTYQEIDAIMENLNGEPDFGAEQNMDMKLPAPVKSPTKKDQANGDSPQLRASKLTAFQNDRQTQSPAVSTEWLREQQQSMRTSSSPVRKLVGTKDTQVSDWDDMLESGDESKFVPHAQFFDTRIKSLIEGVLQQHLNPLQKSLKDVGSSVKAASKEAAPVAAATERTDSDADDEDNADDAHANARKARPEKKLDQIRSIVNDAIKPLAMGNTALPDASEIREMINDAVKSMEQNSKSSVGVEQVRSIITQAMETSGTGRQDTLDIEQMKLVVAESVKAFGQQTTPSLDSNNIRLIVEDVVKSSTPQPPAFETEKVRSLIEEAVKAATPVPAALPEFDPEHMKLVVAETIKTFGVASSSMDPEQMRSVVTEALKASVDPTPSFNPAQMQSIVSEAVKANIPRPEPSFDPDHMKLVVAETVKAFGGPPTSTEPEQIRSIVSEAIHSRSPPDQSLDPEHMRLVVAETIKAFGGPSSLVDSDEMRSIVSETLQTHLKGHDHSLDPENMKLVVSETVKALHDSSTAYDPEQVRLIVTEAVRTSSPPAFDPDEIRAIVKEVVNFSKAGEASSLEPEHFRSIVLEAIASSGLREAISSSGETSNVTANANNERLESELRLRTEAEQRANDYQKMLELSEKEISLYKENSVHADHSIHNLREDKQSLQLRIAELEKVERGLRTDLSGQSNELSNLNVTLEQYRTNATRWQDEIDSVNRARDSQQSNMEKLQQEAIERQQASEELNSKYEALQEKLAGVARNYADARDTSLKKSDEISSLSNRVEALKEKLQFTTKTHNADRETFRTKDEEAAKELSVLSAQINEERRIHQRLENKIESMLHHEKNSIRYSVQLEETRLSNDRLIAEIQKLRNENMVAQNDVQMREREIMEAKDIARSEIQRSKGLLDAEKEVEKRKFDGVRTDLETRLEHVREELKTTKRESEQQRVEYSRRLDQANQARIKAVREAAEQSNGARNEERNRFERLVNDLSRENDMAMRRALDDHQRGEIHFREALKVKDEKLQLLEDKCRHMEDKVTVAQSAAQAAATAAQQKQQAKTQNRETLRPSDGLSLQSLRESIVVLQEQLQERESRIESLEAEHVELQKAKESEKKLTARETEINWLRELLGVRVDDLSELVNMLSGEDYDRIVARDAAIRIRANLQMEQQEKERLISQSNKTAGVSSTTGRTQGIGEQGREMLRDVSNFATPRAAQIAAVWGNWRKGQASPSLSSIRDAVANPGATPSRHVNRTTSSSSTATDATEKLVGQNTTAAQTFLSGLMTPPASNYVRRTPTPSSTRNAKGNTRESRDRTSSFTQDGRELDAQPLSLSLEDELEAADDEHVSPQQSPTKSRPPRIRAPQTSTPTVLGEGEDPLRTPFQPSDDLDLGQGLDAGAAEHAVKNLDEEMGGIGEGDEIARDTVVSPLGPPEKDVNA